MKKNNFFTSLPFKLLVGVIIGIIAGIILNKTDGASLTVAILNIIVTVKYVLGQLINFCVPLIIIGFIAPSITKLGNSASRMLGVALVIAYVSSIGAALFSTSAGYILIPHLSIVTDVEGLKDTSGSRIRTFHSTDHVRYECSGIFYHGRSGCYMESNKADHRCTG